MKPEDVRDRLVEALEADLVGPFLAEGQPGAVDEVLPLAPSRWYLTGLLAPRLDRAPDPDDEDSEGELEAGGESQPRTRAAPIRSPSGGSTFRRPWACPCF